MSTATLSSAPVTQMTFPWEIEDSTASVAEYSLETAEAPERGATTNQNDISSVAFTQPEEVAPSLQDALVGERIGRPFRMGSVMFRLLKSYGITDDEIAAGVAAYNAKRAMPASR